MILITEEILESTLDNITALDEEGLGELLSDYFGRQPFLMTYMMTITETLETDAARNDLIFLLLVMMECYYSFDKTIPMITEENIDAKEKRQVELLVEFEKITDPEEQERAAITLFSPQVHLFDYIGEIMNSGEEEDSASNFSDDDAGVAFGCLKIVSDLLTLGLDGEIVD